MIEVRFWEQAGLDEFIVKPALYQWDYNRTLKISLTTGNTKERVFQVHFCNRRTEKSIVRFAYWQGNGMFTVDIPNGLLQEQFDICAYLYMNSYTAASGVDSATEGTYYVLANGLYTPVTLPANYIEGQTYYARTGATEKKIIIPVIPRKKPDNYIEPSDPTGEELVSELVRYINGIDAKFNNYAKALDEYQKTVLTVQEISRSEYDALYAAGSLDPTILYYIVDSELVLECEINGSEVSGNAGVLVNDNMFKVGAFYLIQVKDKAANYYNGTVRVESISSNHYISLGCDENMNPVYAKIYFTDSNTMNIEVLSGADGFTAANIAVYRIGLPVA